MKKLLGLFLCLAFILNINTTTFKINYVESNTYYSDINTEKTDEHLITKINIK